MSLATLGTLSGADSTGTGYSVIYAQAKADLNALFQTGTDTSTGLTLPATLTQLTANGSKAFGGYPAQ